MHHEGSSASDSAPLIPLSEKLQGLSSKQSKSCIFRVHKELREVKKEVYEPMVIAIGPYHRNRKNLQMMEEQKLRYLRSFLKFENENVQFANENVDVYVSAVRKLEEQVRNFYAEPLDHLSSDELAEMMVLDGCFIIQLLHCFETCFEQNDHFNELGWLSNSVLRDLTLYENQIPFFILCKLWSMKETLDEKSLIDLILKHFDGILPDLSQSWNREEHSSGEEVKHLLDLIHIYWQPSSFPGADSDRNVYNNQDGITLPCAIELREAGVKFVKKESDNLFDISFENGILQIPPLDVNDSTETFLRNLLAHEQYCRTSRDTYVAYYLHFLDCLIDSTADVELLRRKGIIRNNIGDNKVIAQLFNSNLNSITFSYNQFRYAGTFRKVNGYCNQPKNRWMAKLRFTYLHSPWGIISIGAASTLLLLTLMQTIFTIFPRGK